MVNEMIMFVLQVLVMYMAACSEPCERTAWMQLQICYRFR